MYENFMQRNCLDPQICENDTHFHVIVLIIVTCFQDEGYSIVACLSVNDPYVMDAWGKHIHAEGKVTWLTSFII